MVRIIVVWKRKKSEEQDKQEGVYYTTIDESALQSPINKQINKMNNEQSSREPQYMEIAKTTQCTEKVTMQDNPAYSEHQHPVKMEMCEGAYSTNQTDKLTMQDNPSYSILCGHQITMENNPAYSASFDTKQ